jgi:hypothetical protein
MFAHISHRLALAAAAAIGLAAAQPAVAGSPQKTWAALWWCPAGHHADLVLRYDPHATVPLVVNTIYVLDAGGYNLAQSLESCGTAIKSGDSVTSYQLQPGQYCFVRAFRGSQQDEIVGKVIVSDATKGNANIQQFVHPSLEIRDGSDNVLTHVEVD